MRDYREKIVKHLVQQKAQAFQGTSCKYRTSDGKMCAIGCLIPDEEYQPWMDDALGTEEVVRAVPSLAHIDENELLAWQVYHDSLTEHFWEVPRLKYSEWVAGDERHHPMNFLAEIEERFGK